MEREGVITISIRSFLWALRFLAYLKKYLVLCVFLKSILKCHGEAVGFMITLVSVLKSVDKAFENVFESCFV